MPAHGKFSRLMGQPSWSYRGSSPKYYRLTHFIRHSWASGLIDSNGTFPWLGKPDGKIKEKKKKKNTKEVGTCDGSRLVHVHRDRRLCIHSMTVSLIDKHMLNFWLCGPHASWMEEYHRYRAKANKHMGIGIWLKSISFDRWTRHWFDRARQTKYQSNSNAWCMGSVQPVQEKTEKGNSFDFSSCIYGDVNKPRSIRVSDGKRHVEHVTCAICKGVG